MKPMLATQHGIVWQRTKSLRFLSRAVKLSHVFLMENEHGRSIIFQTVVHENQDLSMTTDIAVIIYERLLVLISWVRAQAKQLAT